MMACSRPARLAWGVLEPITLCNRTVWWCATYRATMRPASSRQSGGSVRMPSSMMLRWKRSILPWLWGEDGDVFRGVMPQTRMNSVKSLATNCGPLSEMSRGVTPGNFARARGTIYSISASFMGSRISPWRMERR